MKPAGFKKDLLVSVFASALISVANEDIADEDVISSDDEMLRQELQVVRETINKLLNDSDMDTKLWIRKVTTNRMGTILANIKQKTVSLELLAVYILFVNFVERKQKLDSDLQCLTSFDYMDLADRICGTSAGNVEAEMFGLAYEIINDIKR